MQSVIMHLIATVHNYVEHNRVREAGGSGGNLVICPSLECWSPLHPRWLYADHDADADNAADEIADDSKN